MTFEHGVLDGLQYDLIREDRQGTRTYLTPSGARYPSVSSVMGKLNKGSIEQWKRRVGHQEAARVCADSSARGTSLHTVCEKYLNNELTSFHEAMMDKRTELLFHQLRPFLDRSVTKVFGTEVPLYSDTLRLAGTCDALVILDGVLTILDYKTSGKVKRREWIQNYLLQCTSYCLMVNERTGMRVPHFAVCIATEGQTQPTIFHEKTKDHLTALHGVLKEHGALAV